MDNAVELGSKTFAIEDQRLMANWSGDHNPMHVDPVAARRLLTGRPVVHGIHLLLEALARWSPHADDEPCTMLRAEFSKPVSVGDPVAFQARRQDGGTLLIAAVEALPHMTLFLGHGTMGDEPDPLPPGEPLDWPRQPIDLPAAHWLERTVALPAVCGDLGAARQAARMVGEQGAALLGQASTMVGMRCPGLHSVFSSLSLVRRQVPGSARCRIDRVDPRFGLVRMTIDGGWSGELRAFVRAAPQGQADMSDVAAVVQPKLRDGYHTWVLGGSRGLGELAAKIAAAAGSRVTLTYAEGEADAHRVAREINACGRGRAQVACYRAGQTELNALCETQGLPDAVLYFATPRIAQRRGSAFSSGLLTAFNEVYCAEPARIATALEAWASQSNRGTHIRLFNPSSTYVDELPNGMLEYAMAKAASEVMAQDLNKRLRHVKLVSHRLPKLATDQTNALMAQKGPPALAVLAPALLSLLGAD